jgi:2-amino-4-hydroxy-6-hydroxymethyldihydropteridine diphosphokinase
MKRAYLLIGGNRGNPLQQLHQAERLIAERCGELSLLSRIYATAAWGTIAQPDFYNRALLLHTHLQPGALMTALLQIETDMGRIRTEKMGPRLIDIDILLMDDLQVNERDLIIPHPLLSARRFALAPLCEIAPHLLHPILAKTIQTLLNECTDTGNVQKK